MKKLPLIFLYFCVLIISSSTAIAQNIKTAKDSAILISCAKMPMAQAQYNLGFNGPHLDLNHDSKKEEDSEEPIDVLIQKIEANPKDYKIARNIVEYYRKQSNQEKFMYYFEPFYHHVYEDYQNNPNDFETVELFCRLLQETQNMDGLFSVWDQFVTDNPEEKRALTIYATYLGSRGDVEKARLLMQQAYDLDNQNNEVYITAFMCELTTIIIKLNELSNSDIDEATRKKQIDAFKIDETFFKKAISNKAPPAAQMALDASNLFLVHYRTIISVFDGDKKLGEEILNIKPSPADEKLLKDIEKRALAQVKKKYKNLYFAHKVLTTIAILRGDEQKAITQWKSAGAILENDSEMLRLLSFGYLLKKDFKNAILFAEKITDSNYEDAFTLGRLYTLNKEYDKAFDLFGEMVLLNKEDERAICAQISILIQANEFDDAIMWMYGVLLEKSNNIELIHYNYYKAITTLIRGDKNDAFKRLKAIHAESEYKEVANKLLEHFFEQSND